MLFALVSGDSSFAVEIFVDRERAESALAEAVADEPEWVKLLSVIALPRYEAVSPDN